MLNRLKLSLFLGLCSCASVGPGVTSPPPGPLYKYRADMQIHAQGKDFVGLAVLDPGPLDIDITSQAKLDMLEIDSCQRTFAVQKVDKSWFGGSGHNFTYHYEPSELENDGICPLYVQAVDASGPTDWGLVLFKEPGNDLGASLSCDGQTTQVSGMAACQAKAGTYQELVLPAVAKMAGSENCNVEIVGSRYKFMVQPGFCYIGFKIEDKLLHFILLGFNEVRLR